MQKLLVLSCRANLTARCVPAFYRICASALSKIVLPFMARQAVPPSWCRQSIETGCNRATVQPEGTTNKSCDAGKGVPAWRRWDGCPSVGTLERDSVRGHGATLSTTLERGFAERGIGWSPFFNVERFQRWVALQYSSTTHGVPDCTYSMPSPSKPSASIKFTLSFFLFSGTATRRCDKKSDNLLQGRHLTLICGYYPGYCPPPS